MEKNLRSGHHQKDTKSAGTTLSDFVLQWGNRKRLRCMKVQNKNINNNNNDSTDLVAVQRNSGRVVRSDLYKDSGNQPATTNTVNSTGYLNLRQRATSPSHRTLRTDEFVILKNSIGMRERSNGLRAMASLDKVGAAHTHINHNHQKTNNDDANNKNHHHGVGGGGGGSASSETPHDNKKGGSSSGSEAIPMVWPAKFVIGLTKKEKEEDFMAMKGSKLPQRPKKRSKIVQRTLNLISPGAWLCDLSLEKYEVREKKVSKKIPRGLKAIANMEFDSE